MTDAVETGAGTIITERLLLRTMETKTLKCTGSTLRHRICNIRDICEIQGVIKWARISRRASCCTRDHENRMDDTSLQKSQKMETKASKTLVVQS